MAVAESDLEDWVLEMLAGHGWQTVPGPDIARGMPAAERSDYREVVLQERLRDAIIELNPGLPPDAVGSAEGLVDLRVYAASVAAGFMMSSNSMGVSFPSRR